MSKKASEVAPANVGRSEEQVWLALSDAQVHDLVGQEAARRGGGGGGLFRVVLALEGIGERMSMQDLADDERFRSGRISRSVILGVVVLGAFALGEIHSVKNLAKQLGMSASTTWRYLKTWEELCVLEEREDRRYQVARRWIEHLSKPVAVQRDRPAE